MVIDDIARRTSRSLEWERLCSFLSAEADSEPAKRACLNIKPSDTRAACEQLLQETNEALTLVMARSTLSAAGLPDVQELLARLKTGGSLLGYELHAVKKTLTVARQMKSSLNLLLAEAFPRLRAFIPRLHTIESLWRAIDESVDDVGNVKDEASGTLRSLRKDVHRLDNIIKEELLKIINSSTLSKALQETIYTNRNGRYVLPVNANMRGQIRGIVHDSSASGLTIYVEPMAVVELANRMRLKEVEIEQEISRILAELSRLASTHSEEIVSSYETAVELDTIVARAKLALRYGGHMPEISPNRHFDYRRAKHPLLVLQSSVSDVIANDIALGGNAAGNTLIITGPNTGGKTVLLKTVGLFALMVRAGLLPAAERGSTAAFFWQVCADIGDEQSLEQSLSTFSSHMKNIVSIVNNAGDGMLVLLDEIGAGTDPKEGAALARAVLEELNNSGAITISTTHYGELKTLAFTQEGFLNGSLEFDEETLSPSYRLRIGVPGSSKATTIAQRLGLKDSLVERARQLMESEEKDLQKVVEQLERKMQELDEREREARAQLEIAGKLKESAEQKMQELTQKRENLKAEMTNDLEEDMKLSREYIKHVIADLQKQPSISKAQKAQEDLEKLRKELGWTEPQNKGAPQPPTIKVGQSVRVRSLGQIGVVEALPDDLKDKNLSASVRAGHLKIKVPVSDLEPVAGKPPEKSQMSRAIAKTQPKNRGVQSREPNPFVRTGGNTIDLRGMRVDEAISEMERFLDESVLNGAPIVMIIHGHGTGAVRNAVRQYLSASEYAREFRSGENFEGGDGVTMVELN